MRRPISLVIRCALPACLALGAGAAHAQAPDAQRAHADSLFTEGQQLLTAGQVAAACAKFEESQREDPKLGRLLNMAYCHQQLGKTATAWNEYNQGAALALQTHQAEREAFARARAGELAAKLSFVHLEIPADVEVATVTVDGHPLPRDQWAVPFPIDPGPHELKFEAPGHKASTRAVTVADAQTVGVMVRPLEPLPANAEPAGTATTAAPAGPAGPPESHAAAAAPESGAPATAPDEASNGEPDPTLRTVGWVVGAAGIVGLGVGAGFAADALSLKGQADPLCPQKQCTPHGKSLIGDATTAANVATVGFAVGLVGLAAGAWLVFQPLRSSAAPAAKASASLVPYVGPDRGGVALEGSW